MTTPKRETRKRRGRGEGSIHQRKDGRWCAVLSLGFGAEGDRVVRKRRTVYGKTKQAVQAKLANLAGAKADGTLSQPSKLTVQGFIKEWMGTRKLRRTTVNVYQGVIDQYINPHIGCVRLCDLSPLHVQRLYSSITLDSRRRLTHAVLRCALERACRLGLALRNPCDNVETPRPVESGGTHLSVDAVKALLEESAKTRYHAIIVLAVLTGMRQGEILGLHWSDVDLKRKTIQVQRALTEVKGKLKLETPKTDESRRLVTLPRMVVSALKKHRVAMNREGLAFTKHVFPDRHGEYMHKSTFYSGGWIPIRKRAKTQIRFHDLRHSMASLLLAAGEHPKVVQERLGHSTVSMTLDVYSHSIPSLQEDAAAKLDKLFRA